MVVYLNVAAADGSHTVEVDDLDSMNLLVSVVALLSTILLDSYQAK